jgi:hypothetical protein
MYVVWLALAMAFAFPQQNDPTAGDSAQLRQQFELMHQQSRQQAMQLNDLLGNIHAEADAQAAVNAVAREFKKELPPAWVTRKIRKRIARAEYEAASDPSRLIPEQRIVEVWNEFVRAIGAPDEALVTEAEIHSMRDGQYATSQLVWARDMNRTIWTMPNAFAVGSDGKVANGCRALEALRFLYDMERFFYNVRSARERLQKGIILSDQMKREWENVPPNQKPTYSARTLVFTMNNPVLPAEQRYIRERGLGEYVRLLKRLFNELFPE